MKGKLWEENDGKQKRKTEAGYAVNKSTFYKEVVQYECRQYENKCRAKVKRRGVIHENRRAC